MLVRTGSQQLDDADMLNSMSDATFNSVKTIFAMHASEALKPDLRELTPTRCSDALVPRCFASFVTRKTRSYSLGSRLPCGENAALARLVSMSKV
jgi:hypothetical protein